jgi:hypothetical protein
MGAPLMSTCENGKKQLQVHVKRPMEKEKRVNNENTNYCKIIISQLFDTALLTSSQ